MDSEVVENKSIIDQRDVLDKGYIELVDLMGDDYRILQTARVSTGAKPSKGDEKDRGLIRYLYNNEHMTPFESVVTTWRMKAPIFVARQHFRHRTMSPNEASQRYTVVDSEYYVPDYFRIQSEYNHQASVKCMDEKTNNMLKIDYMNTMEYIIEEYNYMLEDGIAREQARMILPTSMYTNYYFTVNLRNLFHFLELRLDEKAQYELRQYAESILDILRNIDGLKWSLEVFEEHINNK